MISDKQLGVHIIHTDHEEFDDENHSFILSIFWIMLAVIVVKNLHAGRVTDSKELLNGQYYDDCENDRYTFIQDDKKLV